MSAALAPSDADFLEAQAALDVKDRVARVALRELKAATHRHRSFAEKFKTRERMTVIRQDVIRLALLCYGTDMRRSIEFYQQNRRHLFSPSAIYNELQRLAALGAISLPHDAVNTRKVRVEATPKLVEWFVENELPVDASDPDGEPAA